MMNFRELMFILLNRKFMVSKLRITICFIILLIVAAPTFAQDDEKYIFRETIGVSAGISSYKTFSRYDYNKPYLTKPSFVSVFPEFETLVTPKNPILNYPNPFNYRTRITFLVEEQTQVTINI